MSLRFKTKPGLWPWFWQPAFLAQISFHCVLQADPFSLSLVARVGPSLVALGFRIGFLRQCLPLHNSTGWKLIQSTADLSCPHTRLTSIYVAVWSLGPSALLHMESLNGSPLRFKKLLVICSCYPTSEGQGTWWIYVSGKSHLPIALVLLVGDKNKVCPTE